MGLPFGKGCTTVYLVDRFVLFGNVKKLVERVALLDEKT